MSLRLQIYKRRDAPMIKSFTPLDRSVQSEARVHVMHCEPRPRRGHSERDRLVELNDRLRCVHSAMALKHQCCRTANQSVGLRVAGAKLALDALDRKATEQLSAQACPASHALSAAN
jgi:hypothetical protein